VRELYAECALMQGLCEMRYQKHEQKQSCDDSFEQKLLILSKN